MPQHQKREKNTRDDALGEIPINEEVADYKEDAKEAGEKIGVADNQITREAIRKEIENADLDDSIKMQAQSAANDAKLLDEQEKLKTLLQTAQQKGVMFALQVAKNMDDPYILDLLHDMLVKGGYYKKFKK
ncbi:MAG: hypothetical protein A2908_00960 [Candidatus Staskawiczbacteria bacterium RIFCSPLOWO2_01_FULL_38_12b]|uniref:Uncharacterized protein n=1 Tax=Candidatus Staskawiczbacteria bacterium RIFCSPLOWO2_01_FULL_38_12b TaxID=1802214 RepID=A0A1G2IBN8_9BACT|nr:MAG: hypothetical protein A2908_00960 [Candidatus Staskawiczbacteria bacterium RIFCSPLOWO2_01_FULL_38_12b]